MEKVFDGKTYKFIKDDETDENLYCRKCAFAEINCSHIGDDCLELGGIWLLKDEIK